MFEVMKNPLYQCEACGSDDIVTTMVHNGQKVVAIIQECMKCFEMVSFWHEHAISAHIWTDDYAFWMDHPELGKIQLMWDDLNDMAYFVE